MTTEHTESTEKVKLLPLCALCVHCGELHHLISRGNERPPIARDDAGREKRLHRLRGAADIENIGANHYSLFKL